MNRFEKIRQQVMLCKLLCESIAEEVETSLQREEECKMVVGSEHRYWHSRPVVGYTQIDNDIIKLRRELAKLGRMTGGREVE